MQRLAVRLARFSGWQRPLTMRPGSARSTVNVTVASSSRRNVASVPVMPLVTTLGSRLRGPERRRRELERGHPGRCAVEDPHARARSACAPVGVAGGHRAGEEVTDIQAARSVARAGQDRDIVAQPPVGERARKLQAPGVQVSVTPGIGAPMITGTIVLTGGCLAWIGSGRVVNVLSAPYATMPGRSATSW